jgi:hypothetical protein
MYTLIQYRRVRPVTAHARPTYADVSDLFHAGLRDPSNLELDWLWLAAQVTRVGEQTYCFQQALRINPRSALAQRGLAQLEQRPGAPLDFKGWWQHALRER